MLNAQQTATIEGTVDQVFGQQNADVVTLKTSLGSVGIPYGFLVQIHPYAFRRVQDLQVGDYMEVILPSLVAGPLTIHHRGFFLRILESSRSTPGLVFPGPSMSDFHVEPLDPSLNPQALALSQQCFCLDPSTCEDATRIPVVITYS